MVTTEGVAGPESMGAHFSLAYRKRSSLFADGWCYVSARSALFAVLDACRPALLHVPNFICPVVFESCEAARIPVRRYRMNSAHCAEFPSLRDGEKIIVPNYFGLGEEMVSQSVAEFGADRVIVDSAQGFFLPDQNCLATLYSPRKFLPVADGGLVKTELSLRIDLPDEKASLRRSEYLLSRIGSAPESSRSAYVEAEKSLSPISFESMSTVTKALAESFDLEFIRESRRKNFLHLARAFDCINQLSWTIGDQVPLCYPLLIDGGERIRAELLMKRIFLPIFWPGIAPNPGYEAQMAQTALHLPVDHRYREDDMNFLIDLIEKIRKNN
ncbi:hypothetical protein [Erythrobacter sp. HI0019]|nr:hypothetical protein [Erythrobacter sp. HI0019]